MDSQQDNIQQKVSAIWPSKQTLEGSLGCLRVLNPISNSFSVSTCILLNERTILTQAHYVFNRSTCSYLTQLQLSIGVGESLMTYQVTDTYILQQQKDSTNEFNDFDFVIVSLDKQVNNTNQTLYLNKQLEDYENKVEQLQNYIQKIQDHFEWLAKYSLNQDPYTRTQYILQRLLQEQINLYGEYSPKTINIRELIAHIYSQINVDWYEMIEQKLKIARIYEQNDMDDQTEYANTLYEIGSGYKQLNEYQKAVRYLEYSLHLQEELDYLPSTKAICARQLTILLQRQGVNPQAIKEKYKHP